MTKAENGFTGLINQGATCYLNSLIQTLYMTPDFTDRLFAWEYDSARDGKQANCIPLQLQRLFARLKLSKRAAITTKDLTTSFGWNESESFRQHDVSELMRVLFEALETPTEGDEDDINFVNDLYEGVMVDYVRVKDGAENEGRFHEVYILMIFLESIFCYK